MSDTSPAPAGATCDVCGDRATLTVVQTVRGLGSRALHVCPTHRHHH